MAWHTGRVQHGVPGLRRVRVGLPLRVGRAPLMAVDGGRAWLLLGGHGGRVGWDWGAAGDARGAVVVLLHDVLLLLQCPRTSRGGVLRGGARQAPWPSLPKQKQSRDGPAHHKVGDRGPAVEAGGGAALEQRHTVHSPNKSMSSSMHARTHMRTLMHTHTHADLPHNQLSQVLPSRVRTRLHAQVTHSLRRPPLVGHAQLQVHQPGKLTDG